MPTPAPVEPFAPRWSVVIPYFNEADFIGVTLESLAKQSLRPFRLILVDNASTDQSATIVSRWAAQNPDIETLLLAEPQPGQVHALKTGIAAVQTEYLAIADADTFYPANYLAIANQLLCASSADTVGFIAFDAHGDPARFAARARRWLYSYVMPWLLPMQAHGGGYAHLMKTAPFRASGGYSPALWPYVLKDHELAHRLMKEGRIRYAPNLVVHPSTRRTNRSGVRWTLFERVLYHATPPAAKDWFWYRFMRGRFEARGQKDTVLRAQPWNESAQLRD
jgi:glycosyltransferase involved in cell wall biosynthesis